MKTTAYPLLISTLLVLLLGYTSFSKLMTLTSFKEELSKVPLLSAGAAIVAPAIPLAEMTIVVLLLFPRTRLQGLYCSAVLLSAFTVYLLVMLLFAPYLPCSCGGIINGMGWWEHALFNAGMIGLCVCGVHRYKGRAL